MSNDGVTDGCHDSDGMQPVDKVMLAAGIIWCLFLLYSIALLLPPLTRPIRAWELRHKPSSRLPTYPQRIVFLLLTLLMEAVALSAAFHRDLRTTIHLKPGTAWWLMILLPVLYFALGARRKDRKNGTGPIT